MTPERAGTHGERIAAVRALQTPKGRREQRRFAFEGATLLGEALANRARIVEVYATDKAYAEEPLVRDLGSRGVDVFLVDDRTAAKISDLETPPGIVAVAEIPAGAPQAVLSSGGLVLVLADLNDPGNAGTLVRSAAAFGCAGVAFGRLGADPYHPKVVRAAMGAIFSVPVAVVEPNDLEAAKRAGTAVVGLEAGGEAITSVPLGEKTALVVGHERQGLGRWRPVCGRFAGVPMPGSAESLNAAVAGSIALYALCQESIHRAKSQDYPR